MVKIFKSLDPIQTCYPSLAPDLSFFLMHFLGRSGNGSTEFLPHIFEAQIVFPDPDCCLEELIASIWKWTSGWEHFFLALFLSPTQIALKNSRQTKQKFEFLGFAVHWSIITSMKDKIGDYTSDFAHVVGSQIPESGLDVLVVSAL